MVKILLERHCKPGKEGSLENMLISLRTKAMQQPGYLSGETLVSIDDPLSYLVISTWTRMETWKAWENNRERMELAQLIAALLSDEPRVRIYGPPMEKELNI